MTRKELIKALATKQGITQATAEAHIDAVKSIIVAEISAGREVVLGPDLGTFKPTTRTGVVPGSKPARQYSSKSTKFDVSAAFKRTLNS